MDADSLIPTVWRPLYATTFDGLVWLGSSNLRQMIEDWRYARKINQIALREYKKMQKRYGSYESRVQYCMDEDKKIESKIKQLTELVERSEEKALLHYMRRDDYFAAGEEVYCFVRPKEFEAIKNFCFVSGRVEKKTGCELEVKIVCGDEECIAGYEVRSAEILSRSDLASLKSDLDYAALFFATCEDDDSVSAALSALACTSLEKAERGACHV